MRKTIFAMISILLFSLSLIAQWQIPDKDMNVQDNKGRTALIRAAMNNDLETVKAFIVAGADPNMQDDEGFTAPNMGI